MRYHSSPMRIRFCRATNVKPAAQFQQEPFQVANQCLFKVAFAVFVLQVEEFQEVRVADLVLDRDGVLRPGPPSPRQHGRLLL